MISEDNNVVSFFFQFNQFFQILNTYHPRFGHVNERSHEVITPLVIIEGITHCFVVRFELGEWRGMR